MYFLLLSGSFFSKILPSKRKEICSVVEFIRCEIYRLCNDITQDEYLIQRLIVYRGDVRVDATPHQNVVLRSPRDKRKMNKARTRILSELKVIISSIEN